MNWFGKTTTAYAGLLLGGAAMGALLLGPQFAQEAEADPITIEAPRGAPLSFADLIDSVSPAVVSVNVRGERELARNNSQERLLERFRGVPGLEDFLEERRREEEENGPATRETRALGSGFFISEDGYVVTNNHVIDGATEIQLVMSDGTELDAELIGTDPETDLAVVKVTDPGKYAYVEFEQTDKVRVGDWVVALGNPFGLGGTATAGIVSADGRDLGNGSPYTNFLQIDASINQGNSGGPTFDLHGRVIGVNTQILSPTGGSVGIGFAIPAELAVSITDELIKNGEIKRGWLGVQIGDFRPEFAEALDVEDGKGALVADVTSGSPADKAGIKRSDVIIELNGTDIEGSSQLTRLVAKLRVDSENDFVVLRRGERKTIKVTVGERPKNLSAAGGTVPTPDADEDEDGETGASVLGVTLSELTDEDRETLGLRDNEKGLLVKDIERSSPFARVVGEGFALLEVNNRPMESVDDLQDVVAAARRAGKERVLITVRSVRGTNFATVDISETDDD